MQRPLPVPFLKGFRSSLILSSCTFLYFSCLYLQALWAGPLTNFLSLAFLLHLTAGVWEEHSTRHNAANKQVQLEYQCNRCFRHNMLFLQHENRDTSPVRTMVLKLFAAKKIFFQVSSFSWLRNNFNAIQPCVYKKTCLLSTWQKRAEVVLQKRKQEGYFLAEKISIQDWKQDGKWLKQTLGFPVQGSFHSTAQDYLR